MPARRAEHCPGMLPEGGMTDRRTTFISGSHRPARGYGRDTRAPCDGNVPACTTTAVPNVSRIRLARVSATASPSTIAYTDGPHELCPTPGAPHSRITRTIAVEAPRANVPPCAYENQRPLISCTSVSAAPNVCEIALDDRRQHRHQYEVRHALPVALVRRRKRRERFGLGHAAHTRTRRAAPPTHIATSWGTR